MLLKACTAAAMAATALLRTARAFPVDTITDAAISPGNAYCLSSFVSGNAKYDILIGADWNDGEGCNYINAQLEAAIGWVGDWSCTGKGTHTYLKVTTYSGYAKLMDAALSKIYTQIPAGICCAEPTKGGFIQVCGDDSKREAAPAEVTESAALDIVEKRQLAANSASCGGVQDFSGDFVWYVYIGVAYQEGEGCNYIHDTLADYGVPFIKHSDWTCASYDTEDWTQLVFTTKPENVASEISSALSKIYTMVPGGVSCVNPVSPVRSRAAGNDTALQAISKRQTGLIPDQAACGADIDGGTGNYIWIVDIAVAYQDGEGCNYIYDILAQYGVPFVSGSAWTCARYGTEAWTELSFTTEAGNIAPLINGALSGIYTMVSGGTSCVNPSGTIDSRSTSIK